MAHSTVSSWFSKMLGGSMKLDNLEDLLFSQLKDLYSAEEQLIEALPKMAAGAHSPQLRAAFNNHLAETRRHKERLERVFRMLDHAVESESCDAMEGLIAEGEELMAMEGDPEVKDAALIAGAQRVEHYEIAGYGCARTFAHGLGRADAARLLQETLNEEGAADKALTQIAEASINQQAAQS